MAQVTIYKPLVPVLQRWSVRAQLVFIGLSAGAAAGWGVLQMYPDTMKRWGLAPGSDGGNLVSDLVVAVLVFNAFYGAFTIALAAAKQKGGTAPPASAAEADDLFSDTKPGATS